MSFDISKSFNEFLENFDTELFSSSDQSASAPQSEEKDSAANKQNQGKDEFLQFVSQHPVEAAIMKYALPFSMLGCALGTDKSEDSACEDINNDSVCDSEQCIDADGDGVTGSGGLCRGTPDCDDNDPSINPAADEICHDGIDQDCDGLDPYADLDNDEFGAEAPAGTICDHVPYFAGVQDCDDSNDDVNPLVLEACNGIDDNCDGEIDNEPFETGEAPYWYEDADGDGHGTGTLVYACEAPDGYTNNTSDCDDTNAAVFVGAEEICGDGIDNDCNGISDDGTLIYPDIDNDGYGDENSSPTLLPCSETVIPSGYSINPSDCDDTASTIYPYATETCNDLDDDCDGAIDELEGTTWYLDQDGDGYGREDITITSVCDQPDGYAAQGDDCDDYESAVNPLATEIADNGIDDNCDGIEEVTPTYTYYLDSDGDGYGDASVAVSATSAPAGYVSSSSDCDDTNPNVNPDATEICGNNLDDNCDSAGLDGTTWYADADSDTFGDSNTSQIACDQPTGTVADATDCDDTLASVYPGADETCNSLDDDCDGSIDEDATDAVTYYADTDGDTFGDLDTTTTTCDITAPVGFAVNSSDCDDTEAAINTDGIETCNTIDDDCDGSIDEEAIDAITSYADADADSYGTGAILGVECEPMVGAASTPTGDCDDSSDSVYPGAQELCNSIDDDCNGLIDDWDETQVSSVIPAWYSDMDADGFGNASQALYSCDQPIGTVADGSDCDDTEATTYPGATEYCDSIDTDCDGALDAGAVDGDTTIYPDADADSFGDSLSPTLNCGDVPAGYTTDNADCDDSTDRINPDRTEECNTLDDDCDGDIDDADPSLDASSGSRWYADADIDGYGDPATSTMACEIPAAHVADSTDCDDTDDAVNPAGLEVCNSIDDDCDGLVDDNDSSVDLTTAQNYYFDNDHDGFAGITSAAEPYCEQPSNYYATADDCDDIVPSINPNGVEICNSQDDDCDGVTDNVTSGTVLYYNDTDRDGFGDILTEQYSCNPATLSLVDNGDDCDDTDNGVFPNADEYCNSTDDDCDGNVDEYPAVDATPWYLDNDGDTYGNDHVRTGECDAPASNYVEDNTDCDDSSSAIHPNGTEVCDFSNLDEDCDGLADDNDRSATGKSTWYEDSDADGHGFYGSTTQACDEPSGYTSLDDDCDDDEDDTLPGAGDPVVLDNAYDCNTGYEGPYSITSSSVASVSIFGDETNQLLGSGASIFASWDANGDGNNELIIGSTSKDAVGSNSGAVYIYSANSGSGQLSNLDYATLNGFALGDSAGRTVLNAGHVMSSSSDTLLITAPYTDNGATTSLGTIYGYETVTTGDSSLSAAALKIEGSIASARLGTAVTSSDLNGDSTNEVIAGAPYDSSNTGSVYAFEGPISGSISDTAADETYDGNAVGDTFGEALCSGDFDGDGYGDLVIGSTGTSETSILFGATSLPASGNQDIIAEITFEGAAISSCLAMPDRNSDSNTGDELVLASKAYSSNTGAVGLQYSDSLTRGSTFNFVDMYKLYMGSASNDYAGTSIAIADLDGNTPDGDENVELIIGKPTSLTTSGLAYLFWGESIYTPLLSTLNGSDAERMVRFTGSGSLGTEVGFFDYDLDDDMDVVMSSPNTNNTLGASTISKAGGIYITLNNVE